MALPTMSGYDAFGVGPNQSSERSKFHTGRTGTSCLVPSKECLLIAAPPVGYALGRWKCTGARYSIAASVLSPRTTV